MSGPRHRRELLGRSTTLNGIDFVEVAGESQTKLVVHFQNAVPLDGHIGRITITGGESIPTVTVLPFAAPYAPDGKLRLDLHVVAPGDFSTYTLAIESDRLDPYFARARFSFKALCDSTLDCAAPAPSCPAKDRPTPPIDYLAKDFLSFRSALSDFSALRYPGFQERAEADFGVMFLEALSALADDLSYTQDRIAAEAYLDTATERRSLVRHARLVDYQPRPATAARVLLRLKVNADGAVPAGMKVSARDPDGAPIEFETGMGLFDAAASYIVRKRWDGIAPYWWDDSDRCLRAGATEVWVVDPGHELARKGGSAGLVGRQVLIETAQLDDPTQPKGPTQPPLRHLVRIVAALPGADPLFLDEAGRPAEITLLRWDRADALARDVNLTRTELWANLVPATQGRRIVEAFGIEGDAQAPSHSGGSPALARLGPAPRPVVEGARAEWLGDRWIWGDGAIPQYLYTLRAGPLAWLAPEGDSSAALRPEAHLVDRTTLTSWEFRTWLLDAGPREVFTIDPIAFRAVGGPRGDGTVVADYDGRGDTIRFGDGTFGAIPAPGSIFEVTYRVGGGARGNVAADAITQVDPASDPTGLIRSVTNPFPAEGGADEEADDAVRRLAPEAFRARPLRAVLPADYEAAAEELPWVQRAGTTVRWTGSWLTVFTAVDPRGGTEISSDRLREVFELLDRRRLAGHESYVLSPEFVSIDLEITVCAHSDAFRGDVHAAILEALGTARRPDGTTGFFHPDRFTFGVPLERSALEAAIQRAHGVDGVRSILYRRRGQTRGFVHLPDRVTVGPSRIIRADNDPNRPERGSIRVYVEGGK